MRFVIIGAGAVGGAVGARLHEAGEDVVLVARGAHLEALRRDGLRFVAPDGERTLSIPAVGGPDELELRPDDVLLLATKSQDTAAALATWAPAPVARIRTAGGLLPLVCVQNGVANERAALRQFANVYAACVWLPSTHLAPGLIVAPGTPVTGVLHLGRYPEGADHPVRQLSERLAAAGVSAPVREDAMRWKYGKLLGNLGNVLDALLPDDEAALALYERVRDEGRMVLGLAGIPVTSPEEERAERDGSLDVQELPGYERTGGSTWQSLERGLPLETDYLNGEIVLIGRLHGVAAPLNAALQRFARRAVREGWRPRSRSAADVEAELG